MGVGNGMNTSTVPTWQSESSKAHDRGKMVMIEGMLPVAMITQPQKIVLRRPSGLPMKIVKTAPMKHPRFPARLFGYDQGVTGGLLDLPSFIKYFPAIDPLDP
jgi:hypothetical protein